MDSVEVKQIFIRRKEDEEEASRWLYTERQESRRFGSYKDKCCRRRRGMTEESYRITEAP